MQLPGFYRTRLRRRWTRKSSTITNKTPEMRRMRVTLSICVPFLFEVLIERILNSQQRRSERNDKERRKDEEDERENQFHRCPRGQFFHLLSPSHPEAVGINAQNTGNTGAKLIGLDDRCNQSADDLQIDPVGQTPPGIDAHSPCALFENHESHLVGYFG